MLKSRFIIITVFFAIVFIFRLFIVQVFAVHAEYEMMEKLEKAEKAAPPEVIVRPTVEYKAADLRDPFQGPTSKEVTVGGKAWGVTEEPLPPLTVQGVIWGGKFPQAIINNKVVKVGDTIEEVQVISINKDGIDVVFKDRQYNLPSPAGGAIF